MKKKLTLLLACLFLSLGMALAQTAVSGTVVDANDGQPVVGASVKVLGTRTGTVTNIDGKFSVSVPNSAKELQVSYVGMLTKTVRISKGNMRIILEDDSKTLDEVMVVAYGKQKKSSFTGSAGVVNDKTLNLRVVSNATNALAGQVSGVQILNTSGQPGSSATIRVRGIGSMSSSNAPLIVVDGVPYDGSISSINPTDIASMTILKDAASNAIYGARGANGVVLITTKSGNSSEAQVTFDAKWGTNSRCVPQYDVIGAGEYYETQFKAMYNSKAYHGSSAADSYAYANKNLFNEKNGGLGYQVFTVPTGQNLIGTNFKLNPNAKLGYSDGTYYYTPDNWYDEAFSSNLRQEYNATVSGKTDRMNYYGSVGYLDDSGLIKNSSFKRYSSRANIDYQAKKWLRVGTNLAYSYSNSQSPSGQTSDDWGSSGNIFYVVNSIAPIYPLYVRNADGSIKINSATGKPVYDASTTTNFHRAGSTGNAVRDIDYNTYNDYRDLFTGKWYAQITPVEGLVLTANIAANVQNDRANRLYNTFGSYSSVDGASYVYHEREFSVNNQYMADYSHTFAEKHNFELLVGYEQYKMKDQFLSGYNDHLYDPFIGELNNAGGSDKKSTKSYTNKYMSEGVFSRLQYDYEGKYFGSVSYRHDGSSRFSKENRWGDFGSIGGAWLITKENFMKDISWVNTLKYKISWGKQGNDDVLDPSTGLSEYYAYLDQYTPSYNNGNYSLTMYYKGNKNLTWETSYSFNTGIDFDLFGHRLNGSFEYWSRKTENLIYNKPLPVSSGIITGSIPTNSGSVMNKGIEFNVEGVLIKERNISWALNMNLTHYKSEIKSLDADLVANGGQKGSYYIRRIGGSMQEAYLKRWAGVDPETGQGLYYIDPDNGNWNTTSDFSKAKQSDIGDILPTVYGGFGTTLNIYGFDFTAMFSYQLGGQYYDGTYQSFMHTGCSSMAGNNWSTDIRNAWTPTNRYTDVPRLDASDNSYQYDSSRWLVSSDYLSVNNITLGYTVPKSLLRTIGISALRVYVSGDNLAVISARKGLDPRMNFGLGSSTYGSGASQSNYSVLRTVVGGIQLTF